MMVRGPSSMVPQFEMSLREICPQSGAQVIQLTSAAAIHTHIYPDTPVFTPDSQCFVYARFASLDQPREYWLCELPTGRLARLTSEPSVYGPAVSPDGRWLLYMSEEASAGEATVALRRLPLAAPGERSEVVWTGRGYRYPYPLGTIGPDGRRYATKVALPNGNSGILAIDVEERRGRVVHESYEIFNAHPQFEPGAGHDLLIQHNRGCLLNASGQLVRSYGEEGITLYLIDREGGNLRRLAIGTPYSRQCQGHQAWLGPTGRVLATIRGGAATADEGNLVAIGPGEERPTVVARGFAFAHLGVSRDGRYFVCDVPPRGEIVVGSVATGRIRLLCESGSSFGWPQYAHPHPFFSPDSCYVLFNSDRTGLGQIFAAHLPDTFLASLDA